MLEKTNFFEFTRNVIHGIVKHSAKQKCIS